MVQGGTGSHRLCLLIVMPLGHRLPELPAMALSRVLTHLASVVLEVMTL